MTAHKTILLIYISAISFNASTQQASLAGLFNTSTTKNWITENPCLSIINELINYLRGYDEVSYKLIAEDGKWKLNKNNPLNESGFSALPGGYFQPSLREKTIKDIDAYFWLTNFKVLMIRKDKVEV